MQADALSRWVYDKGDYTLHRHIFSIVQKIFAPHIKPEIDMFASPGNKKLLQFVSRWPHFQAWDHNALEMSLQKVTTCYANPPWTVILPWLERLRRHPHVQCLMAVPLWVGAVWWPLLLKLCVPQTPKIVIYPRWGLFQNCQGEEMPPTKWPLRCVILSGKCWRENKFQLKISHYI